MLRLLLCLRRLPRCTHDADHQNVLRAADFSSSQGSKRLSNLRSAQCLISGFSPRGLFKHNKTSTEIENRMKFTT